MLRRLLLVSTCLVAFDTCGLAAPQTFHFTGVVEFMSLALPANVGDSITGSFTFESTAPNSSAYPLVVGDYWHAAAPYGVEININGVTISTDPAQPDFLLRVVDSARTSQGTRIDAIEIRSPHNLSTQSNIGVETIFWRLEDATGTALSTPAILAAPPVLSQWQSQYGLNIYGCDLTVNGNPSTGFCKVVDSLARIKVTSIY